MEWAGWILGQKVQLIQSFMFSHVAIWEPGGGHDAANKRPKSGQRAAGEEPVSGQCAANV
jgi:hypothetical protein